MSHPAEIRIISPCPAIGPRAALSAARGVPGPGIRPMESVKLATKPRPGHGSRSAKKLRRDGLIPAVVYGHKQNPVGLAIDRKELETALRRNARVVDLQLDGSAETAVISGE